MKKMILLLAAILLTWAGNAQTEETMDSIQYISPLDFGLAEAESDSARYEVLYRTHQAALAEGKDVSYEGIESLTIQVSAESKSIPLTPNNDFHGLKLTVRNNAQKFFLFEMIQPATPIEFDKKRVDDGDFRDLEPLNEGDWLLILEDETPWVANRAGYAYGATRKDILYIQDGKAKNKPIALYDTDTTHLKASYCPATTDLKTISNLTILRDSTSTYKTKCIYVEGFNNVKISNVQLFTPQNSTMYADEAITFVNCANVTMEDVRIDGTYSQEKKYGYGIMMNNVWNATFQRLDAHAQWGVFGTNNMSNVTLRDCDINRFDVHCYGKDIFIYNCKFSKLYNQFSSIFGTLLFDGCRFVNFVPVLVETSYNVYTPFDLTFKNCVMEAGVSRNYLISIGKLNDQAVSRPELARKCWPNVTIQNLIVNVPDKVSEIILFKPTGEITYRKPVDYVSQVKIDGLSFHYSGSGHAANFVISSAPVTSTKTIQYDIRNMDLLSVPNGQIKQATKKYVYPASLTINLFKNREDVIKILNSRLNYNVVTNAKHNIRFTSCTVGMIRYSSDAGNAKRVYKQCTLYLNNADDNRYYIDNHAEYEKCTFIPCNAKMFVDFYGTKNDVTIKNCKTTRTTALFYRGSANNTEMKSYQLKGERKNR
ncbi:MAG: right-handed parallel beta-helix repeat-containing protein [Bacteroidales bacterium]|nr:right-handed parallel beta-helix repeat-containing protein [Bacteroidales bacterium]